MNKGELPGIRTGKDWRVKEQDVVTFKETLGENT